MRENNNDIVSTPEAESARAHIRHEVNMMLLQAYATNHSQIEAVQAARLQIESMRMKFRDLMKIGKDLGPDAHRLATHAHGYAYGLSFQTRGMLRSLLNEESTCPEICQPVSFSQVANSTKLIKN